MNTYPPFHGRGFGYGPMVAHFQQGNSSLEWATFALVLFLAIGFALALVAVLAGRGRHRGLQRGMFLGPPGFRGSPPDALEMLRMRFASGQMTRDEFLQATRDLTSTAPTPEPPPAAA
jgi:hypothetical protein